MNDRLQAKLIQRMEEGTLRSLSSFHGMVDFYSNDYLGLGRESHTFRIDRKGSGGSRLLSGNSNEAEDTEQFLAAYFDAEAALVFNSGYDANLGVLSSIPQRGDVVLYDELVHASARDGLRLSYAHSYSFKHNDLEDLARKLEFQSEKVVYVVVESLYSMDGDICPLQEIVRLCIQYGAYLIVDEAHAAGVFGKGLVDSLGLKENIFARIITFGKAYGCHGAVVLGDKILIDYLLNFARSFIYTTALPPHSYVLIAENVNYPKSKSTELLKSNISFFRSLTNEIRSQIPSDPLSPIQLIQIGDKSKTSDLALKLQNAGFAVKPIFAPTVPIGKEGLRICIHSFNTTESIKELVTIIVNGLS